MEIITFFFKKGIGIFFFLNSKLQFDHIVCTICSYIHLKLALFQTKCKKIGKLIILWFIVEAGYNFFCSLFDCICVFFLLCSCLCFLVKCRLMFCLKKANCYVRTAMISWQLIVVYVVHNVNIEMHYFFLRRSFTHFQYNLAERQE